MQHAFLPIPQREYLTASTCITVTSHDGDTFSITPRRSPPPHLFFGMGIVIAIPAAAILLFNWPLHITIGSTAVRSLHLQVMLVAFLLAIWLLVVLVFFAAQRSAWAEGPFLTYSRTDGIIRLPRSSIDLDRRSVAAVEVVRGRVRIGDKVQSTTYSLAQVILRLSEPADRVLVVSQSTARAASRLAESLTAQLNVPCEEIWQRQTVWDEHLFSDL